MNRVEFGDCRDTMRAWAAAGVKAQMCVTSPPYFGLRSYMPDAVKLRCDISPEDRAFVLAELERRWLGCELNPAYKPLQDERLRQGGLILEAA